MGGPAFGFSVGDFIAGAQILTQVIKAFKEAGGASSKYLREVSFLNSFKATLEHLERFVSSTTSQPIPSSTTATTLPSQTQASNLPQDISKLLQDIKAPWQEFKTFLDRYETSLGAESSRSRLAKVPRTVQFTVKDIGGKVEKLRNQVEQPLQAVNSLLALHVIDTLSDLPNQLLSPSQRAQLIEAIKLADIPTSLSLQIEQLQRVASSYNMKQDQQLQIVETLKTQLEERITGLQSVLEVVAEQSVDLNLGARERGADATERHEEQVEMTRGVSVGVERLRGVLESRADQLQSALKEQKQLVLALKSFLEDKSQSFLTAPDAESPSPTITTDTPKMTENSNTNSNHWPSTLSTAYFAALLLSSILSSVTTTALVTRTQNRTPLGAGAGRPVFLPVDHSLPGLGALNSIRIHPSLLKSPKPLENESASSGSGQVTPL
ncbi:uncharacterized protein LY89DRAFT_741560 [Mollisia scopiformis]|uniref:Uncharacterized protein n=1 Tax=Mollisia scopiformis TaxID=149040 RepID=A0A132B8Y8_MOLSC|nr:uncharacterized protein LY89DRAFT_741560 [Mollisia scopiformis]KUJ08713.1 hypothetical protein LY89DRAFT_741560 [Mollisia scopiformis]